MTEITESLHHIDTRLTVVESDLATMIGDWSSEKKWIRGIAVIVVVQVIVAVTAFAKLSSQVDHLNLEGIQANVSTSLQVLADHGTELATVRTEQARVRGVIDSLRSDVAQRTKDRFTGRDGDRLELRLKRVEDFIIEHNGTGHP